MFIHILIKQSNDINLYNIEINHFFNPKNCFYSFFNYYIHPTTHAPTHARPSLPVIPDPNLTPPNIYGTGLHYTAAHLKGITEELW